MCIVGRKDFPRFYKLNALYSLTTKQIDDDEEEMKADPDFIESF